MRSAYWSCLAVAIGGFLCQSCSSESESPQPERSEQWQVVHDDLPGGLLSVWGSSPSDVWTVGGGAEQGSPTVLHYDGVDWQSLETGTQGDLLWVFGFEGGPVYMGGDGGTILRYSAGQFEKMETPSDEETIFGIWGSSEDEVWAVGGRSGGANGAFAWRLSGDVWREADDFPGELASRGAIWKAFGRSSRDTWLVGTNGEAVHWNGEEFSVANTGVSESLFTVHANSERFVAVGGYGTGLVLENDGSSWVDRSPKGAAPLTGVYLTEDAGFAVGQYGSVYERSADGWREVATGLQVDQTLHSVWVDADGGVWAAGGDVLTKPLVRGVLLHRQKLVVGG